MASTDAEAHRPLRRHIRVPVGGIACSSDAVALERALSAVAGVFAAYVNTATDTAYVAYDPGQVDGDALAAAVTAAGYRAGRPVPS
ncbi:MAG: heavy metal-associated domain-containing protein [Chloroflexi bacterium]|nr:heavy metal-associated domain-containing protein [Chloroflexota bacterium]MDA8236894.1 heavy metal-associated domain-containing protein [Chloroflexota bacterium]